MWLDSVRKLRLERKSMPKQDLILRVILWVKVTSVVGAIVAWLMFARN